MMVVQSVHAIQQLPHIYIYIYIFLLCFRFFVFFIYPFHSNTLIPLSIICVIVEYIMQFEISSSCYSISISRLKAKYGQSICFAVIPAEACPQHFFGVNSDYKLVVSVFTWADGHLNIYRMKTKRCTKLTECFC